MLWCFVAFFLPFLKSLNCINRFSRTFLTLRTNQRPFFESVLKIENVLPTVFRIPAPYDRGAPCIHKRPPLNPRLRGRGNILAVLVIKVCFLRKRRFFMNEKQGYLAHEKTPPPLGATQGPRRSATAGS